MSDTEWYGAMAKAMKAREHALSMLERWTNKLNEAEGEIKTLAASQPQAQATEAAAVTEQE